MVCLPPASIKIYHSLRGAPRSQQVLQRGGRRGCGKLKKPEGVWRKKGKKGGRRGRKAGGKNGIKPYFLGNRPLFSTPLLYHTQGQKSSQHFPILLTSKRRRKSKGGVFSPVYAFCVIPSEVKGSWQYQKGRRFFASATCGSLRMKQKKEGPASPTARKNAFR